MSTSDRLRHTEPEPPGRQHGGEIGAFDADAQGVEGAMGGHMGIGADDQVAGGVVAALGQHLMADAVAHFIERGVAARGEGAHGGVSIGRFRVRGRRIVIEHEGALADERQVGGVQPRDRLQRIGAARVMHHGKVHARDDDIAGRDGFAAGVAGHDLLGNRGTHISLPEISALELVPALQTSTPLRPEPRLGFARGASFVLRWCRSCRADAAGSGCPRSACRQCARRGPT